MKKIITAIMILASTYVLAFSPVFPMPSLMDTVVVKIGDTSRIMILVDSPEALKEISQYDVNTMLKELSQTVDSTGDDQEYIRIEDETGDRYFKATEPEVDVQSSDWEMIKQEIRKEIDEAKAEMQEENTKEERTRKSKRHFGTKTYFNFEFGMNNYMEEGKFPDENNALYTVKPWGSWYPAFTVTNRSKIAGPLYLDWGAGISWYNFKHQNFSTRLEKTATGTLYYEDPDVINPIKSKLSITHLNLNLVPVFHFGNSGRKRDLVHWDNYDNGIRFGVGGYVGYRIKSWTKYTWKDGNKQKDHNPDNYYLNNVRYGVRTVFGFRSLDLFANYDISELFSDGKGPRLNAFSFGIIL